MSRWSLYHENAFQTPSVIGVWGSRNRRADEWLPFNNTQHDLKTRAIPSKSLPLYESSVGYNQMPHCSRRQRPSIPPKPHKCASEHGVLMNRCVLLFSSSILWSKNKKQSIYTQRVLELAMAHTCKVIFHLHKNKAETACTAAITPEIRWLDDEVIDASLFFLLFLRSRHGMITHSFVHLL